MQIKDIPKSQAVRLIAAIAELRPDMNVKIISEDYVLYQLGLIQYIPCTVEIDASEEEIYNLVDEVDQMEIDAYNFDDRELKEPTSAKLQRELEEKYFRYSIIEAYLR